MNMPIWCLRTASQEPAPESDAVLPGMGVPKFLYCAVNFRTFMPVWICVILTLSIYSCGILHLAIMIKGCPTPAVLEISTFSIVFLMDQQSPILISAIQAFLISEIIIQPGR